MLIMCQTYTDAPDCSASRPAKRRKTEDAELTDASELKLEALQLLRRSRLISENGIGATWGEPVDIVSADAAIRAWRPIQAWPDHCRVSHHACHSFIDASFCASSEWIVVNRYVMLLCRSMCWSC
jgi:hypothetical protein